MKRTFSYLAGLIDGEGCIAMYARKDKKAIDGLTYMPYLTIAGKDKWFLEEIKKSFGGAICLGGVSPLSKSRIYSLRFRATEIRKLLPKIIPHLILKKQEAIVLREGLKLTADHRRRNYNKSLLMPYVTELKRLKTDRFQVIQN